MKIAYIVTRADAVGGASIHVRDMAQAMRQDGHDAFVIVGGTGPVMEQLTAAGVPFYGLPSLQRALHPLSDWRALHDLRALLSDLQPDLVSTHTAKAGWLGRAACARLKIPCLYTPHGWTVGSRLSEPAGSVFTVAERIAARWSDAIVCVCEYECELALRKRVARPSQLHVIHNGVRDVSPRLRAIPAAAPPRICSVARFEAPKDHATLLRALASLRDEHWTLDLVGDGPLEGAVRNLVASLGIAGRVRLLGYLPDPAEILAASQLFVLSSRSEAFPRSILEAMRAGLPVIASDVGGVREAVASVVPAGDAAALARAIRDLLRDPGLRTEMGAAARHMYERRFTFSHMLDSTRTLYATVLNRAAPSLLHAPKQRS